VTDPLSAGRATGKRRRILEAAWRTVLRHGLRGMTMEALAREAGIAKGTLYAQFADKDAVIGAIIDDMLIELQTAFGAGMAAPGPVAERVGAALAGKYGIIVRALEGSPHADEVFNEHHRFAERFETLDRRVEAEIAAELAKARAPDAAGLARVVIGAANGLARNLSGAEAVDRAIRLVCRRLIEPEVATPSPPAPAAPSPHPHIP
jgi:AcrR family transcriptional regulator